MPSMNTPRLKHCQIILRDMLFVFFGHKTNDYDYTDTLEYLDLKDPNSTFQEIKI